MASEEPVLETGVTAEDEKFSINTAFALMLALSVIALVGIVLGFNPFSLSFNAAFVFVPTLGLLAWFAWTISNKN